ncbi:MAG: DUF839 domain-containing protein [Planctomycetota bacterium]|nr:DUF839 domain-containing protein [Planctomycetota bacterium]
MRYTRRHLLRTMAMTSLAMGGLARFADTLADAARDPVPFDGLADDPRGLLDLPPGFTYHVVSRQGQTMADGLQVPGAADGMAAFPGPGGTTLLVRNHELEPKPSHAKWSPFGAKGELASRIPAERLYTGGLETSPDVGGTTTVVYDPQGRTTVRQFLSLGGTRRNCSGGPTPWGTWLSCEETAEAGHGFVFEVRPTVHPELQPARPLKAMGRFEHEAAAVDPVSGVIYMTEDLGDGLLYRFLPRRPEQLAAGGRLQVLAIRDKPQARTNRGMPLRRPLATRWIDVDDVESPKNDLRKQGWSKGAARFDRGEGMWTGTDGIYLCATTGGPAREGQIWRYTPSPVEGHPDEERRPGKLTLFLEPNDARVLENADNITVAPWGDLVVCEDNASPRRTAENRLVGVTPEGRVYPIARNRYGKNPSELAGACFSPDGSTLFVNVQFPGTTFAITGPWPRR